MGCLIVVRLVAVGLFDPLRGYVSKGVGFDAPGQL